MVEEMQAGFDAVAESVAGQPRPRVFYELDATGAFYGPADNSFLAEMIELAGAEAVTTGSADRFDIPVERLLTEDPEVILLADAQFGVTPEQVGGSARLGRHHRREERRHPPDRRPDGHSTRPSPAARPPAPGIDDPPGRTGAVASAHSAGGLSGMAAGRGALVPARPMVGRVGRARGRSVWLGLGGIAALVVALILGIGLGSVAIPADQTFAILVQHLFGIDVGVTVSPATDAIVWDLRVPRVLTAMIVGTGLAVAGCTFQGLLRNPLADPYVLGSASGAALGAAIALLLPVRVAFLQFGLLQLFAFTGALLATLAVYRLSRIGGLSPMTSLLLTGYAVGSLLAAGLAMAMYLSGAALRQIFSYLLGGFDRASWDLFLGTLPIIVVGSALILARSRALNGMLLGEEAAAHLGVDVRRERAILLVAGLARHGGGRCDQRADRVRRAGRAARRPPARRPERAPRPAAVGDRRRRAPRLRRHRGAAARRHPGRHRDRRHRRAVLPGTAPPDAERGTSCDRDDARAPRRQRRVPRPCRAAIDRPRDPGGRAGRARRARTAQASRRCCGS